jgi:hypothetical protein
VGLTLSLKPGDDFYADHERFIVMKVASPTNFTIRRARDGVEFDLLEEGREREIAQNVMAAVNRKRHGTLVRIHLTAPKAVKLQTGERYRSVTR